MYRYKSVIQNIIQSITNNEHLPLDTVYRLTYSPEQVWLRAENFPFGVVIADFTEVKEPVTYIDTITKILTTNNIVKSNIVDENDLAHIEPLSELLQNPGDFYHLPEKLKTVDKDMIISLELEKENIKGYFMLRPFKNLILTGSDISLIFNHKKEIALLLAYPKKGYDIMLYSIGVFERKQEIIEADDEHTQPRFLYLS